ncbi:proline iminopeptidase [Calocera cornea HHB12733]|uniref:Proline iminopeptidase n=1 Tax=Calocera cornea HHB12733 TaxID=1353952 RepID=A0A165IVU7_9BASI|nr:proline iminopeptidase [Calocera cornea HHB12733]
MDQYRPTARGKVAFGEWETAYEIFGTLPAPSGEVPLIGLHGGPGIPGRYLLPLSSLVESHGIPLILYDQIGCGNSTHLREKGGDFWTVELFLKELENLLEKLGIKEYDLLGHSWGAMLAAEHALLHPPGLRKIVLSDGLASMKMWEDNANALVKTLPQDAQDAIEKYERLGDYDAPEYKAATEVFYNTFVCRMKPWPVELLESFRLFEQDTTVYLIMLGASEFSIFGTLKSWDIVSRLSEITAPTLVINSKYDEASDVVVQPFADAIKGSKWVKFEESAHMPMLEEREKYVKVVGEWLAE